MTLQCHDHHDIIIYSLINKEFLIKKFSHYNKPIAFCLLDCNTFEQFSKEFPIFPLFIPTFSSRISPYLKIPEPLEKLTFTISARLKIGSKKEKKQPNVKKKLRDYMNF